MQLPARIREYYLAHLGQLPVDKQLHFASRLQAWERSKAAADILERLRPQFVPEFPADGVLGEILLALAAKKPPGDTNAAALRARYFARYPKLYGLELALFRVRHWLEIYDVDARDAFFVAIPEEEVTALERALLKDPKGLRILSTYAVNFLYLYERVLLNQYGKDAVKLKRLYKIGKGYNLKDDEELRLCVYFYTHCIIAETNYYTVPLPCFGESVYKKMLKRLENIITAHYDRLSLDAKLEFVVCTRILDYKTSLLTRIYTECEQSVSEQGTWLIDRHNDNAAKSQKISLADSEHRNVLYIMSQTPFTPTED